MISTVYIYISGIETCNQVEKCSTSVTKGLLIEIAFQVLIIYCYLLVDHCNTTMLLKISAVIEFAIVMY